MKDYGADPLGNGMFCMVPSGDVVDYAERCKRLEHFHKNQKTPDCIGLTWEEIAMKQGGLNMLGHHKREEKEGVMR